MAKIFTYPSIATQASLGYVKKNRPLAKKALEKEKLPPDIVDGFLDEIEGSPSVKKAMMDLQQISSNAKKNAIGSDALFDAKSKASKTIFAHIVGKQVQLKLSDVFLEIHVKNSQLELWHHAKGGKTVVLAEYKPKSIFFDPEDSMGGKIGTESQAKTLIAGSKAVVLKAKAKLDDVVKQMDKLDKANNNNDTMEQMGAAMGAVKQKAGAAAKSADLAARAAPIFRSKLNAPRAMVEKKILELKMFRDKDKNDWSKKRGLKLPSHSALDDAISGCQKFLDETADNQKLAQFIKDKKLQAELGRMIAKM